MHSASGPGAGNALGHVKFLFPNAHNVYLHDTPADTSSASRPARSVTAAFASRNLSSWRSTCCATIPSGTSQSIGAAMHAGVEKHVKLKEKIPVHIVYFTAWVDENGGLHFQPDIYGYDHVAEN